MIPKCSLTHSLAFSAMKIAIVYIRCEEHGIKWGDEVAVSGWMGDRVCLRGKGNEMVSTTATASLFDEPLDLNDLIIFEIFH